MEIVIKRVAELMATSWSMSCVASGLGLGPRPFIWDPLRREMLRAELDAMIFHVFDLAREEVVHILDTFTVIEKYDQRDHSDFRTKRLILEYYDLLAEAKSSGVPYQTPIDPPPGQGPRHAESTRPDWMKDRS